MKKVISISLLVVYSVFSIGIVIHNHYCYNTLYKSSLLGEAQGCCTPTNEKGGCCSNSVSTVKIDDSYDTGNLHLNIQPNIPAIVYRISPETDPGNQEVLEAILDQHKFPHLGKLPIYLTKQVFII